MDHIQKLKHTVDALFGSGVSRYLPSDMRFTFSKKNNRIRSVYHNDKILCTLRIDGGLAISPYLAEILLQSKRFRQSCLEIDDESRPFVEQGRSVFCQHVVWCGRNVHSSSETVVLHRGAVVAVGKAVLSRALIVSLKRGVAVRVRDSLKDVEVNGIS